MATSDAWIAATATLLDVPLLTHNAGDFESELALNVISQT
jgi:predicted nucleic acid-binding protein